MNGVNIMLNHKGTLTIESNRLRLRRFNIKDAEDMFSNWASDTEVTKFLSWEPHNSIDVTKQVISDWINDYDKDNTYNWCIVLRDSGKVIGLISVVQLSNMHEMCEIGYCLGRAFWNNGIITEALQTVIKFLFQEVGINRIQAKHDLDNPSSGKVMEKVGMKYEGLLRQSRKRKDGTYGSTNIYSILRNET
jgi:[ribosomal protein S5]-alanine N-acetyltransferase